MTHHQQQADRNWRTRAACLDVDPELFFPTAESGPVHDAQVAAAKAVCAGCPVRAECLTEALARIAYGVAGGLTEQERHRLRRGMSRPGAPGVLNEVLVDGPPPGMTARERAGVGRLLLATGRSTRQVATDCRVTTRTVERWATTTGPTSTNNTHNSPTGERSHGGHRAPLRTSHPTNPQAGTRAAEGDRA
jgi:hypothetical protein